MIRRGFLVVLTCLVTGLALGRSALAVSPEARLAIEGYDPVAYFTESRPTVGDPRFEYAWDGALYRFASARHLEFFKADPDRYAPQYGNFCTAALARGYRVISDPNNWIIQNGRLHLFGGPAGPDRMRADPAGMKARADANFPRIAELPWETAPPQPPAARQ